MQELVRRTAILPVSVDEKLQELTRLTGKSMSAIMRDGILAQHKLLGNGKVVIRQITVEVEGDDEHQQ